MAFQAGGPRNSLSAQEAENLFAKVDNSGHTNAKRAQKERERRREFGHGVAVDPLSTDDPSGSNVGTLISHASAFLVAALVAVVVFVQYYSGNALSNNTAALSHNVSVRTVADALGGGVEWGNGFTQFPDDFSVQEADENTGRIEVSVVDTSSANALACFSNAQIQSTALSVNSLLNPSIDIVIYHVGVYEDTAGTIQRASFFGFLKPQGVLKPFMTFIWTKTSSSDGQVRFNCTITGMDDELAETLRDQIAGQTFVVEQEESETEDGAQNLDALRR